MIRSIMTTCDDDGSNCKYVADHDDYGDHSSIKRLCYCNCSPPSRITWPEAVTQTLIEGLHVVITRLLVGWVLERTCASV